MRRKLAEHGIDRIGKEARQIPRPNYGKGDLLIGMVQANHRIFVDDVGGKTRLLMEYTDRPGDVADLWYADEFDTT